MVTANFVESNSVVRQPSEIIGLRAVCVHQNEYIDRFFFLVRRNGNFSIWSTARLEQVNVTASRLLILWFLFIISRWTFNIIFFSSIDSEVDSANLDAAMSLLSYMRQSNAMYNCNHILQNIKCPCRMQAIWCERLYVYFRLINAAWTIHKFENKCIKKHVQFMNKTINSQSISMWTKMHMFSCSCLWCVLAMRSVHHVHHNHHNYS